jgi:hypothetical protein
MNMKQFELSKGLKKVLTNYSFNGFRRSIKAFKEDDDRYAQASAYMKELKYNIENLEGKLAELQAQKSVLDAQLDETREYCLNKMLRKGLKKAGNAMHILTVKKGSANAVLVQDDDYEYPDDYLQEVVTVKKLTAKLKKDLKEGKEIEGFHLEDGKPSLIIN